jgi:glycosyltransferase involved in cell wall biosynthesis
MTKVLLVGPLPPPAGGGATVTRVLLGSELPRRFGLVHCDISTRRGIEQQGRFGPRNFTAASSQVARFARLLLRERPHLVHLPVSGTLSGFLRDSAFIRLAAARGATVLGHVHGGRIRPLFEKGRPAVRRLVRATFQHIDVTIALSPLWEQFFRASGLARRVTVIPNPVDDEFLAALPESVPVERDDEPFHVLFVGALGRDKGAFDLVGAAAELLAAVPRARVTLIGPEAEPRARERLIAAAGRHGIGGRICLPGPIYGEEKVAAFLGADLLCLPSYHEAFPCTILEGMAAGLPIVASTVGGIPDIVRSPANGRLVPAGDVPALGQALRALAADPAQCRAIGVQNAATVRAAYTVPIIVDKIAALYREMLT